MVQAAASPHQFHQNDSLTVIIAGATLSNANKRINGCHAIASRSEMEFKSRIFNKLW